MTEQQPNQRNRRMTLHCDTGLTEKDGHDREGRNLLSFHSPSMPGSSSRRKVSPSMIDFAELGLPEGSSQGNHVEDKENITNQKFGRVSFIERRSDDPSKNGEIADSFEHRLSLRWEASSSSTTNQQMPQHLSCTSSEPSATNSIAAENGEMLVYQGNQSNYKTNLANMDDVFIQDILSHKLAGVSFEDRLRIKSAAAYIDMARSRSSDVGQDANLDDTDLELVKDPQYRQAVDVIASFGYQTKTPNLHGDQTNDHPAPLENVTTIDHSRCPSSKGENFDIRLFHNTFHGKSKSPGPVPSPRHVSAHAPPMESVDIYHHANSQYNHPRNYGHNFKEVLDSPIRNERRLSEIMEEESVYSQKMPSPTSTSGKYAWTFLCTIVAVSSLLAVIYFGADKNSTSSKLPCRMGFKSFSLKITELQRHDTKISWHIQDVCHGHVYPSETVNAVTQCIPDSAYLLVFENGNDFRYCVEYDETILVDRIYDDVSIYIGMREGCTFNN